MAFWSDPSALFPKQSHRWVVSFGTEDNSINNYLFKSIERPSYEIGSVQAKYLYSHTFNFPKRAVWKPIKIELEDVFINSKTEGLSKETDSFNTETTLPTGEKISLAKKATLYKSTQAFFYLMLKRAGYRDPSEYKDASKNLFTFRNYHFKQSLSYALMGIEKNKVDTLPNGSIADNVTSILIKELDGDGNILEQWELFNPFITDVTFNKLDYSSDNVLSISATVVYDWAQLIPKNLEKLVAPKVSKSPEKPKDKKDDLFDLSKPVTDGKSVVPHISERVYSREGPQESESFKRYVQGELYIPGKVSEQ